MRNMRMCVTVVCVLLAAFTVFMLVTPYEGVVVITDSMQPAVPKWSFVLVHPADAERMAVGEIVLFAAPEQAGSEQAGLERAAPEQTAPEHAVLVLHRIVGIDEQNQLMLTKGDTNHHADLYPVSWSDIQGGYVAHMPAAGWLVYYARQYATQLAAALLAVSAISIAAAWLPHRRREGEA